MTIVGQVLVVVGAVIALLAGIGLLRFETTYARLHAAGKASPVSFLVAALGAALIVGLAGAVYLAVAATAMAVTLPLGVHLLFRGVQRTTASDHLTHNALDPALTRSEGQLGNEYDGAS